jgi:hypothetical protein
MKDSSVYRTRLILAFAQILALALLYGDVSPGLASGTPVQPSPSAELPALMPDSGQQSWDEALGEKWSNLVLDARRVPEQLKYRVEISPAELEQIRSQRDRLLRQIGINKVVASNIAFSELAARTVFPFPESFQRGVIRRTDEGRIVWTAGISAPDASAVRIRFTEFSLPDGSELYVYNLHGFAAGPYVGLGPMHSGDFWTPVVPSQEAYLEVRTIPGAANLSKASLTIEEVAYMEFQEPEAWPLLAPNAECVTDVNCVSFPSITASDGGTYSLTDVLSGAVAHMVFSKDGSTYACSGGLVINDSRDFTPYFLTANHCISAQASAESLVTYWDYKTSSCNSSYPSRYLFPSALGSNLLATSSDTDFTLLRLTGLPPGSRWFLGWTPEDHSWDEGALVYRVSHPKGSPQMASVHSIIGSPHLCSSLPQGSFNYSRDLLGAIEPGSSGSPSVLASGQIVGQLLGLCGHNPGDACDSESNQTVDGNFAATYPFISQWLSQSAWDAPGNYSIGGYLGVGTDAPQRAVHVKGSNAVFRLDRSMDTAAFLLTRTDAPGNPLKSFVVGVNASGANQGEFIITDIGATVGGGGQRRMTITNSGDTLFGGNVTAAQYFTPSSLRLKTNVSSLEDPIGKLRQLDGVRFNWRSNGLPLLGLVAEKVSRVVPEAVSRDGKLVKGVNYDSLIALQIEVSRAQLKQIQLLKARRDQLMQLLQELKRTNGSQTRED